MACGSYITYHLNLRGESWPTRSPIDCAEREAVTKASVQEFLTLLAIKSSSWCSNPMGPGRGKIFLLLPLWLSEKQNGPPRVASLSPGGRKHRCSRTDPHQHYLHTQVTPSPSRWPQGDSAELKCLARDTGREKNIFFHTLKLKGEAQTKAEHQVIIKLIKLAFI